MNREDISIEVPKVTPESIEDALEKMKEAEAKKVERTKEDHERNRMAADDAFHLCQSLEEILLKPAGVKIDDKDYTKYRVHYELVLGPYKTRPAAVKAAMELLERLKAGGLVK